MDERYIQRKRANFFNFDERLEKAKQDAGFYKVREYTRRKFRISTVKGVEVYPHDYDEDYETLMNFELWKQKQLKIDE